MTRLKLKKGKMSMLESKKITRWCRRRKITDSGCWEYLGFRSKKGYGSVTYKGKVMNLSRAILIELTGKNLSNPDILACHKCNNPPCFNPSHLYWGSRRDNINDAILAGTTSRVGIMPSGVNSKLSKFNAEFVMELRRLHREQKIGAKRLSKMFGVNCHTIAHVIYGKTYKNIP